MKNIILVDQQDINILQKADMEQQSKKDLILFLINNNVDINNPFIKKYEQEYQIAFNNFTNEKNKIISKYLTNIIYTDWTITYQTRELSYYD